MINIVAKCMTLFMFRMEGQGRRKGTFTAEWLTRWRLHEKTTNPPDIKRIAKKLEYLHRYDMESAYTPKRENSEHPKTYKRRLYTALLTSIRAAAGYPEMRAKKL